MIFSLIYKFDFEIKYFFKIIKQCSFIINLNLLRYSITILFGIIIFLFFITLYLCLLCDFYQYHSAFLIQLQLIYIHCKQI